VNAEDVFFIHHDKNQAVNVNRLYLADLALDTLTINGRVTTCDCLWSGLPVLTLMGDFWAQRVGASLYHGLGLNVSDPDFMLVARSVNEYIENAV